jgi:signal transduction histidine kinase
VVKTFLDFSRPIEVRFEDVDLAALVREVADFIRPQAALSGIQVSCTTPPESARMSGDPDLLKQAALNLITNAVEAMAEGGELHVSVQIAGSDLILEIADTGPGIPDKVREKVFQLYFTTKSTGSGIGLAMTYRAVQLHNGSVSFSSEAARGTTFRLAFPATVRHA